MSFKFNFDLPAEEEEDIQVDSVHDTAATFAAVDEPTSTASEISARLHTLEDLISQLPPHITYSTLILPTSSSTEISIPRRDLYDVKMQLMAEDTMSSATTSTSTPSTEAPKFTAAFADEDIRTNLYEGGLKSWECSSDLVKQLASDVDTWQSHSNRIIELGCGTALPTCYILQTLLSQKDPSPNGVHLTLADYNLDVLRLVTLPNLLLAYHHTIPPNPPEAPEPEPEDPQSPTSLHVLELTPTFLTSFTAALHRSNISISFLSGPWSPPMISLIHAKPFPQTSPGKFYSLLLASETIYSPTSIPLFLEMIEYALDGNGRGVGYIAAKDVYFGVGGSVVDFVRLVEGKKWDWEVVREEKKGVGVGRVVGVVRKA
ncbi:hypothetical protein ABW19_dt0205728 [Dactylella cylindrospora]|nr:hypothetical protein ABW19_dt0205728 [Dactylella cylindrospora]